ncbi:MAG: hypothetical protein WCR08_11965 [Gammaproteobacteria bacterium]
MPRIVIAGAGPIGLYTAILLRERYPEVQVTVLDHRIGRFDRPGVIAIGALEAINESFARLGISPIEVQESGSFPPAIHIKDLQKALYERVIDIRDVEFIDKDYFSVDHEGVKVIDDEDLESILDPCDLLIDCTGEDRAVTENLFGVENISDNPIKNHFIAYIYVNTDNDMLRSSGSTPPEILGVFRERTRWREFVEPEIDMRRWEGPVKHKRTSYAAKYCLYFEIPDWLNTINHPERSLQEYKTYLSELLKLKYGKEIQFVASTDKGAFGAFEVNPKHLRRFIGKIGVVPVVAVGDALISAEYRYGTGIKNGVAEAYMLTSSLRLSGTKITVDETAWRQQPIGISGYLSNVDAVVGEHKRRICNDYASKKHSLLQAKEDAYIKHTQTPSTASDFDKLLFANHCKEKGDGFFKKSEWGKSQDQYLEAIDLYEYCSANLSGSDAIEARDKQIRTLSNLGRAFEKTGNIDEAIDCFEKGIYLASNCEISDMLSLDKIPKFLCIVANNKLLSFGENHLEKKEFLERLTECLSRTKCDTTPYVQLLEETEKTIDNVEKIMGFKKGVKEIKPNFYADGLNEDDSISKDTTSSTRGSII